MKKKINIISKADFTSLYRFGKIPKDPKKIIDATENDSDFERKFQECFMQLPYFSGDEEYLIITFDSNEVKDSISIEEVLEIIPLTEAAKKSYKLKFDSRIKFSSPRFEYIVTKVEQEIDVLDKINGAKALWKIVNNRPFQNDYIDFDSIKEAISARRIGRKSSEIDEDFCTHLLTYERYNFFPKTDLGYFYDVGEVFAHSKGKPTFKGSGFYKFLESEKERFKEKKLSQLIILIEESDEIEAFKRKCKQDDRRLYISAVLFLKFKDELQNKESIFNTSIIKSSDWIKKNTDYENELFHALTLTGSFYGYEKFYHDLYGHIGLPIFKTESKNKERPPYDNEKSEETDEYLPVQVHTEEWQEVLNFLKNEIKENGGKVEIKKKVYSRIKQLMKPIMENGGYKKPYQEDYFTEIKKELTKEIKFTGKKSVVLRKRNGNRDLFTSN